MVYIFKGYCPSFASADCGMEGFVFGNKDLFKQVFFAYFESRKQDAKTFLIKKDQYGVYLHSKENFVMGFLLTKQDGEEIAYCGKHETRIDDFDFLELK